MNFYRLHVRLNNITFHHTSLSSPIGEIFRARLRQFPSLVNCCTIDWFSEWPEEALQSVASTFLGEIHELEDSPYTQGLVSTEASVLNCSF